MGAAAGWISFGYAASGALGTLGGWLGFGGAVVVGSTVGILGLAAGGAYVARDKIGVWTWEKCKAQAYKVLLASLKESMPKFQDTLIAEFEKDVEDIGQLIKDWRLPESGSDHEKIIGEAREHKKKLLTRMQKELDADVHKKWLGGNKDLKAIWESVVKKIH